MPALVTSNFRISNAKQFINSFQPSTWGGCQRAEDVSHIFLFIGTPIAWSETHAGYSDTIVPSPDGDVQGNVYVPYRDMIALDRVANTDIRHGIKRTTWTSGTVYSKYDDQDPSVAKGLVDYFVYTTAGSVFKCLDNYGGSPSTAEPTVPSTELAKPEPFTTSDGYRWQFMYTISSGDQSFISTNYIPVRTLNAFSELDGTNHPAGYVDLATVQKNANAGTLDSYVVVAGGAGYTAHSGGIPEASRTVASNTASITNVRFVDLTSHSVLSGLTSNTFQNAFFLSYTGSEENPTVNFSSNVERYDASLRRVFLSETIPGEDVDITGNYYHIGPKIQITGDGQGANAYATIDNAGASGINRVRPLVTPLQPATGIGNTYTTANVAVIQPQSGLGSGANIRAIIPPPGGHGNDPITELNGWNVIVQKTLTGNLASNPDTKLTKLWPTSNEYRTIGLIRNAILSNGYSKATIDTPGTNGKNWYANATPVHQAHWLYVNTTHGSAGSWVPSADEEVIGLSYGATARLVEYDSGKMVLVNVTANTTGGLFDGFEQIALKSDQTKYFRANGYVINGEGARITPTVVTDVQLPGELVHGSGEILYVENRAPITRSSDQSEDIKLIIEF